MYKIEVSGIKHAKPLVCSFPPTVSAHSHHTFTLCVLELMHSFHAARLFSVLTTRTNAPCFPRRRLGAHQTLTAAFPLLLHLKLAGWNTVECRCNWQTEAPTTADCVCPYSRARAATQLPKHAADGRWQRLVFCYCVWECRENRRGREEEEEEKEGMGRLRARKNCVSASSLSWWRKKVCI